MLLDDSGDVKMQINGDTGAPDEAQEDEDPEAAMMAMMGMSGFGTTKVRQQAIRCYCANTQAEQGSDWKPGRRRRYQEESDMAAVHESVRAFTRQ